MLAFLHRSILFKSLILATVLSFLPASVQAWNFMPDYQRAVAQSVTGEWVEYEIIPPEGEEPFDPASLHVHTPACFGQGESSALKLLSEEELGTLKGGQTTTISQDAADRLSAAEADLASGNVVDAALSSIFVMDDYPSSAACKEAHTILDEIAQGAQRGEYTAQQFADFEARMPSIESLTSLEAKYNIMDFLKIRAQGAQAAGDDVTAKAYFQQTRDVAQSFLYAFPNHPLQLDIVFVFFDSARELGKEEENAAIQELKTICEMMQPSLTKWAARYIVGEHIRRNNGNYGEGIMHFIEMIGETKIESVQNALNNPNVYDWLRAEMEYAIGYAHAQVGRDAQAFAQFERVIEMYPNTSMAAKAALDHAHLGFRFDNSDAHAQRNLNNFYHVFTTYPDSDGAREALWMLGNVYFHHRDYIQAIDTYQQVIDQYRDSEEAALSEENIDFILAFLMNGVSQVATEDDPEPASSNTQVAQLCGPVALQKLLALRGIASRVNRLASLAGTDDEGTTMLGLMDAAEAMGVRLAGIRASGTHDLEPPFIAHIDEDHFVLVTEFDGDSVVYSDVDRRGQRVSVADFAKRWAGNALALANSTQVADLLTAEALERMRGGADSGLSGAPTDCESNSMPWSNCRVARNTEQSSSVNNSMYAVGTPPMAGSPASLNEPTSQVKAGFGSSGVNPEFDALRMALTLRETDISIPVRGSLPLSFERYYWNRRGYHRGRTIDQTVPYGNNIGGGWTHNWTQLVQFSETLVSGTSKPKFVTFMDQWGNHNLFEYTGVWAGDPDVDIYAPQLNLSTGNPNTKLAEWGDRILYDRVSGIATVSTARGLNYSFSAADAGEIGRLTEAFDHPNNSITLEYDDPDVDVGKLTKVNAPSGDGRYLEFSHFTNFITSVKLKDASGTLEEVTFDYSAPNGIAELISAADPNGETVEYTYDTHASVSDSRFMDTITDKMDNVYYIDYNSFGTSPKFADEVVFTFPSGLTTEYHHSFASGGNAAKTVVKNYSGTTLLNKAIYHMGPKGAWPGAIELFYDSQNSDLWDYIYEGVRLTRVFSAQGTYDATYSYTGMGRRATAGLTEGGSVTWNYNDPANDLYPISRTEADGTQTSFTYTATGKISTVYHPSMGTSPGIRYFYDANDVLTKVTDPLGNDTQYEYDSAGNLTKVTDPLLNETLMFYDDLGNMTKLTDANNHSTFYEYDTGGCGSCGGTAGTLTKIIDADGDVTQMVFDKNGNLIEQIAAAGSVVETSTTYEYDVSNRLTKIVSPTGSANVMTFQYDTLGQMTRQVDFNGNATTNVYDWKGQVLSASDPIGAVLYDYYPDGQLSRVTDGEGGQTTYTYWDNGAVNSVTDGIGKTVGSAIDVNTGRPWYTGVGFLGLTDRTEYVYDGPTGLLDEVEYYYGGSNSVHDSAFYHYDDAKRLTKITDWIDGVNGIQYGYDDAGRLTSITDYDGTTLTYGYDAVGNVTSMNDYHGNVTTYTYTASNQLSTITAPGNKVWTYNYNALGQVTSYDHPNGMTTAYEYDNRNRLTKIEHKDGATVLQSFAYDLDAQGNTTKTTHDDGSFWDYEYDGRHRLITAIRNNAAETIGAVYAYNYDDADNLTSKVSPFEDNFDDGEKSGWSVWAGTWDASNGYLEQTAATNGQIVKGNSDADNEIRFSHYATGLTSSVGPAIGFRHSSSNERAHFYIRSNRVGIDQVDDGTYSVLVNNTNVSTQNNTWYDYRIVADGSNVDVYRKKKDSTEMWVNVASVTNCTVTTTTRYWITNKNGDGSRFDDFFILAAWAWQTTTYAYNAANELTSMTDYNGTTTFSYDDFGRTTSKTDGTRTASYAWRYGSKLESYTSNFFDEGAVDYLYGGDGKRRERTTPTGEYTWYNWDVGWNVINKEDQGAGLANGALNMTYAMTPGGPQGVGQILAAVPGSNPATGSYNYMTHDNIRSTRGVFDQSKAMAGEFAFTPYGGAYNSHGDSAFRLFTGKPYDTTSGTYFFPYRYYNDHIGRWISRDPLGMVDGPNVYAFVASNPMRSVDALGLALSLPAQCATGAAVGLAALLFTYFFSPPKSTREAVCEIVLALIGGCLAGLAVGKVLKILPRLITAMKNVMIKAGGKFPGLRKYVNDAARLLDKSTEAIQDFLKGTTGAIIRGGAIGGGAQICGRLSGTGNTRAGTGSSGPGC